MVTLVSLLSFPFLFPLCPSLHFPLFPSFPFWAPGELCSKSRCSQGQIRTPKKLHEAFTDQVKVRQPPLSLSPLPAALLLLSAFPITNGSPPLLAESPSCELFPGCLVDSRDPSVSLFPFFFFFLFSFVKVAALCRGQSLVAPALSRSLPVPSPAFLPDLEPETHVGFWFEV